MSTQSLAAAEGAKPPSDATRSGATEPAGQLVPAELTLLGPTSPLLLGSASPRRRDILEALGIPILVRPSHVPEDALPAEGPDAFVERVVTDKLNATLAAGGFDGCAAALAADTIVLIDNEVLGKPIDTSEALRYLERLSGRVHLVKTRYLIALPSGARIGRTVVTEVSFRAANTSELRRYAETGEGLDKAGGYAAQGIGAFLVQSIAGSYTNVVGLPACEVISDLCACGVLTHFPRPPTPTL